METKIIDDHLDVVLHRLGFSFFVSVRPVGCKGAWLSVGVLG